MGSAAFSSAPLCRPRSTPARKPESIPRTSEAVRVRAGGGGGGPTSAVAAFGVRRARPPFAGPLGCRRSDSRGERRLVEPAQLGQGGRVQLGLRGHPVEVRQDRRARVGCAGRDRRGPAGQRCRGGDRYLGRRTPGHRGERDGERAARPGPEPPAAAVPTAGRPEPEPGSAARTGQRSVAVQGVASTGSGAVGSGVTGTGATGADRLGANGLAARSCCARRLRHRRGGGPVRPAAGCDLLDRAPAVRLARRRRAMAGASVTGAATGWRFRPNRLPRTDWLGQDVDGGRVADRDRRRRARLRLRLDDSATRNGSRSTCSTTSARRRPARLDHLGDRLGLDHLGDGLDDRQGLCVDRLTLIDRCGHERVGDRRLGLVGVARRRR